MPASTALSPISATHSNSSSSASAKLVLTFSDDILAGSGLITITDGSTQTYIGKDGTLRTRLIGATDTRTVSITDTSKVSISGDTVTITLDSNLAAGKNYSVQMGKGVLLDESGAAYAGLSDTTKLKFIPSATATPSVVIDGNFAIKNDTGVSNGDFITRTAAQIVGGTYTGTLAAGEFIEVSLDNGATWLTATTANNIWSAEGTLAGSSTIIVRASNAAGGHSAAVRHTYTLDTNGPAVESVELSDHDLMAGETATVTVTFSEAVTDLDLADFEATGGVLSNLATTDNGKTWTATLTPTANVNDGAGQVTLKAGALADLAGNSGPTAAVSESFTYNTVPDVPTATVTSAFMTDTGSSSTDFITNSTAQSVSGKYAGTLAADEYIEVSLDNGVTWTQATATAGNWSIPATTISADNTLKARVTNGTSYSNPLVEEYTLDQAGPTLDPVMLADSTIGIGETPLVTFTFSEAVTAFTNDDITVSGGTLSAVSSDDGGVTWTATFTPSESTTALTNAITVNKAGLTDIAGNAGSGSTGSANYAVDTVRPTVTSISLADSTLGAGESTTVTFTFSEVVTGLTIADITVANGTLSGLTASDAGTIWTATLTPSATGSGSGSIQLTASSVVDTAGNDGSSSITNTGFSYAVAPAVTVASVALSSDTGTSGDFITSTASQTISGTISTALGSGEFVEVSLDNGATWTSVPSFSGTSWSLTGQTLASSDTLVARVSNSSATGTELSQEYQLDQAAPTAAITLSEDDLLTGETATVTITFSEAVSGLTVSDFKTGGTLGNLASNSDGSVWTATLTAAGGGEIRLDASSVTDVAGNSGPATDVYASYTYNAAPTATIATASITDTNIAGDYITSSTSQVISGTLSAALGRGQYVEVSLNNGDTWTQATTTGTSWALSGQTIDSSNTLKVRTSNGTDTGTVYSQAYTLDQAAPTLTSISLDKSSMSSGETATVTVVFDEDVSGLAASDFAISGGSLGTFSTSDNRTWTATLTPTASGSVTLSSSAVADTAGNTGPAANSDTRSFTFTVDNTAPSATLTLSDNLLSKNQTATLTLTLTEAVTDTPTASDFAVSGGSLGTFTSTDGGTTWTAILTPTGNAYGAGYVSLNSGTITDSSNNAGPSSSVSLPFSYDTQTLTLSSAIAFSTDTGSSSTDLVTNTGTQTISGSFSGGDIYAMMGAKIEVSTDNGGTWSSATVNNTTHTWSISKTLSGSGTIQVKLTDGSGTSGTPESHTYTIDTTGPGSLASKSPDLSSDSDSYDYDAGGSYYDDITHDDTPTLLFNLSNASLTAGDYVDVLDTSNGNAILGTYTIQSSDLTADAGTISVTPETALSEGTHTLVLRARDAAGNTGTQSTTPLAVTIDKTLASMASETVDLAATSDSGYSSTDNITNDATPDVVVNVANTSGLSAGDILQIVDTSNNDYVLGQYTLTGTEYGAAGGDITITLNHLSDSQYTLALRAIDKAGNTSTRSTTATTLTVDTVAPEALIYEGDSSPYNGETNIGTLGTDVTVKFSEALKNLNAYNGLALERGPDDASEFVFEQGEDYIEYDEDAHTITLHPGELGSDVTYTVKVYGGDLEDAAGNTLAEGTSLLEFTTQDLSAPTTPDAPVLSLADTHYASGSSSGDHLTKNNVLTVTGLTAARYKFSTTGGTSWADEEVTGSTMTFELGDGTFTPGQIIVKQYDDSSYMSDGGTLADTWTIDTSGPSAYPLASSLPNFFGLGTSIPLSLITGTLSESLANDDYLEYTTDNGASWTTASTLLTVWSITGAGIDQGGTIGLRVTDTAGNISSNGSYDSYTLYIGDGYAGSLTASGGQVLYAQGGNDIITISSDGNFVDGGDGNDTLSVGTLGGTTLGGNGADRFTFTTTLDVATLNGNYHGGEDGYTDVLALGVSGQTLSLSTLTTRMAHFETIELGTNNTLTISSSGIIGMSDTDTMLFEGDSSDIVYYNSELWEPATWIGTVGYDKYQLKSDTSVTFTIDEDIQLLGIPS